MGKQRTYRKSVAADIVGADRQIGHLQILDAVDVESLVQDTVLDNLVAFSWSHAAGTKRMPRGLAVPLYPFLNVPNVLNLVSISRVASRMRLTSLLYLSGSLIVWLLELRRLGFGVESVAASTGMVQLPC